MFQRIRYDLTHSNQFLYLYNLILMIVQILVLFFIGIFIGISQSAGSGGGIIINVLLIIGLGYNTKDSVFISYIFLMGGGLAATLASIKKKTPSGKSIIDYDLVMITLPMIMSGAIFGTILNHFISELIISIIFVAIMLYMVYMTCKKYKDVSPPVNQKEQSIQVVEMIVNQKENERLKEILDEEKSKCPISKFKIVLQIYVYTVLILLIKGGHTYDSLIGLPKCSQWSWILSVVHLVLSFIYSKVIADRKMKIDSQKQTLGYVFHNQNDKMSYKQMKKGMFNGFAAGFSGACVGIGGGMVLLPLWFKGGIDKNVAASSTGPLIFFSASVSFFISAMSQRYGSIDLVLIFFATGFVGSYLIKTLILYLIYRYKFKYLVINMLLFVIIISMASFVPVQFNKYHQNPAQFMSFDILC